MRASFYGCIEVVEKLIEAGADVNAKDSDGKNALMKARHDKTQKAIIDVVKKKQKKSLKREDGKEFLVGFRDKGIGV